MTRETREAVVTVDVSAALGIKPWWDIGIEPRNVSKVTTTAPFAAMLGATISISGDTNRMRRRVLNYVDVYTMNVALFVRPSRGFRRHVRRMKEKR